MSPLLLLPLVYFASALQTLQSPGWQIAGVGPDLLALTAFTWLALSKNRYTFAVSALIGLAATLLLFTHGKVAGISGILSLPIDPRGAR